MVDVFSSCFAVRKLGEELKDVGLCCGYGVTVELCGGYGRLDHSIKSLKEYSTPLLLIFATLVSEEGFYKTNTPYEDGDVKKLFSKENPRD